MTATQKIEWSKLMNEALTVEGSIAGTYNRFYNYSYMNQILLMMQGVREPVATYKKWIELDRQVKKGAKAKEIIRPVFYKSDDDENDEIELRGFKFIKCLFTLSETEGVDLPEIELPTWNLDQALKTLEIERVPFKMTNGNVQGYAYDRKLALNPVAVEFLPTAAHELAHILLGHTDKTKPSHERSVKEFQAEATAYIVLNELEADFNKSESRAYIQGWLKSKSRPSDKEIKAVFSAADKILKAGKPELVK